MRSVLFLLLLFKSVTAVSQTTYYIVRHAEKAVASEDISMFKKDPPLSEAGWQRANTLKMLLAKKKIRYIFSTNTLRTKSTAEPLSKKLRITVQEYKPIPDSAFIKQLKSLEGNVLIVGHSNTVDDIVNALCGEKKLNDLADDEYDNLFIVGLKNNQYFFEKKNYSNFK